MREPPASTICAEGAQMSRVRPDVSEYIVPMHRLRWGFAQRHAHHIAPSPNSVTGRAVALRRSKSPLASVPPHAKEPGPFPSPLTQGTIYAWLSRLSVAVASLYCLCHLLVYHAGHPCCSACSLLSILNSPYPINYCTSTSSLFCRSPRTRIDYITVCKPQTPMCYP